MIDIDYRKHLPITKYKRNNLDCYLCLSRQKLIIATPEEDVRQAVIAYLVDELEVPVSAIDAEVQMSHYAERVKGRADIIVRGYEDVPLILVECKAPNQFLSDAVVEQVKRYDEVVKAQVLLVTNGIEAYAAERSAGGHWRELSSLPTYSELVNKNSLDYLEYEVSEYQRVNFLKPIPDDLLNECFDNGYIGEDTNPVLYPILFNLMGWMFDAKDKVLPAFLRSVQLVEDAGIRLAQFGNAGGGFFGTEYRYFILKDTEQNTQIVSLTITGIAKTTDDPHWGTRKGATILAVAIDDFSSSHMSLELRLDKYISLNQGVATIWHDGTLTVGKLGQAKRQVVIDYVRSKATHLVNEGGKIILGKFDLAQEIHSVQPQTKSFLDNLLLYALLRDEYRQLHKKSVK